MMIKDLKDGDHIVSQYLIVNFAKCVTTAGKNYLNLTLQDSTGSIDGKKWDVNEEDLDTFLPGNIVSIEGDVLNYRDHLQMKILSGKKLEQAQIDVTRFVPTAPVPEKVLEEKLNAYIDSLKDSDLKTITKYLIQKYHDCYVSYPAAVRNHHNFASGLLYHSISMADMAEKVCTLYPEINRDFVIAGALIHDLGKTLELSGPIATKYTLEGKLIGHISIMVAEIRMAVKELHIDGETPLLLEHMILSHHSKPEFGSPVPPLTREAFVLASIDDFDAKMNIISKAEENLKPGEWTEKVFAMDNRAFYIPEYKQNPNDK